MILAGQFTTLAGATAVSPGRSSWPWPPPASLLGASGAGPERWAPGRGALAVFAVYAAPIVLSGQATFAGYIKLDDTATWLAMTDRAMEHGRNLAGLEPSTY